MAPEQVLTYGLLFLLVSVSYGLRYYIIVNLGQGYLNLLLAGTATTLGCGGLLSGLGEFLFLSGLTCSDYRLLLDGLLYGLLLSGFLLGCFFLIIIVVVLTAALFLALCCRLLCSFLLGLLIGCGLRLIGLLYLFCLRLGSVLFLLYRFCLAVLIGGIDFLGVALAGYLLAVAALLFGLVLGG